MTAEKKVLTDHQLRVLSLISHGYSNPEMAAELVLSIDTVKSHVYRIVRILGASDRAHAVRIGFEDGLLVPSPVRRPRRGAQ